MDSENSTRRLFLQSAGVTSAITIAGCLGGGSNDGSNEEASDDSNEEASDDSNEESIFVDYGIDGTELAVELAENALGQVAQLRLETPSDEKTVDVGQSITEYSVDILRDRSGTWFIDALPDSEEPIETVELETTFDASVDEIGTLSQLDVTAESPEFEEVNYQLTISNTGDVPIEPSEIEVVVPDLDYRVASIGGAGIERYEDATYGGVVDRDGEIVITAGSDNTYRSSLGNASSTLLIFDQDRANEIAGQSFQGEIVISYQAEREDTVVPITIEMGDEVIADSEFTNDTYLQGTVISRR